MKILISLLALLTIGYSFLPFIKVVKADTSSIFISEFLPDGVGSDSGKEWVELYNLSDSDVSLKDWKIYTKTTATPRSTSIGDVVIKAKSFFIVSEFGDIAVVDFYNVGAGKLNMYNSNAEIYLSDNLGTRVDGLFYSATQEGKSLERRGPIVSDYCNLLQLSAATTMGFENSAKSTDCWPATTTPQPDPIPTPPELSPDPVPISSPEPTPGPETNPDPNPVQAGSQSNILISEVFPSPDKNKNETEWLELYNQDISNVNLSGMYLKERAGDTIGTAKTMLPPTTLEPGAYLIIPSTGLNLSLNNSGDEIFLSDENDTIVDNFKYSSTANSISVSRKLENNIYIKVYNSDPSLNFVPQTPIATPGVANQFPAPITLTISQVKALTSEELVRTTGVVNSNIGLIDDSSVRAQDILAGLEIIFTLNVDNLFLNVGDNVQFTGNLKYSASGEQYLEVNNIADVKILSSDNELHSIDLTDKNDLTPYLGTLVSFEGVIDKNYGKTFYVKSGSEVLKVKTSNNPLITLPDKSVGDSVEVDGILIKDGDYFEIIPRYPAEIKIFSQEEVQNSMSQVSKKINPSTLSSSKTLGENSQIQQSNPSFAASQTEVGKIYRTDSTPEETKVYPWPIYLVSSMVLFFELLKYFGKAVKFF